MLRILKLIVIYIGIVGAVVALPALAIIGIGLLLPKDPHGDYWTVYQRHILGAELQHISSPSEITKRGDCIDGRNIKGEQFQICGNYQIVHGGAW